MSSESHDAKKALQTTFRRLRVQDIMDVDVKTVQQKDALSKVQDTFKQSRHFCLPVVDQDDALVGLVSHKYLYKTQSPRKVLSSQLAQKPGILLEGEYYYDKDVLDRSSLKEMMHAHPPTLSPDQSVADAVAVMAQRKVGSLPVVKANRKVVGMLTQQNVIDLMAALLS